MAKKFFTDLYRLAERELDGCRFRCLTMESYTPKSLDGKEIEPTVRAEAEILRGQGIFSRDRIIVKLPFHSLAFSDGFFDECDCLVEFRDLKLTYVDSRTGNGYCSASGYTLTNEETGELITRL